MYRSITIILPLALACSTPKYDYDKDSAGAMVNSDADESNADADEDGDDGDADGLDEDNDADADNSDGSDADADADADDDGGDDDGGDDGPGDPDDCSHPYNPVNKTSWEKTYTATFISDNPSLGSATATEQGMGEGESSTGVSVFKTWDTLTTSGGKGWEGSVYHKCDNSAGSKLSVIEWNMMLTFDELPTGPASTLMTLTSPREYLTKTSTIGTGDSWTFNYSLNYTDSSGTGVSISVPVSGTYTDMGLEDIDVMGETMEAWHIHSTYTMDLLTIPGLEGGTSFGRAYPGEADYYWVEDVGLVYEKHVDTETEAIILEKTLTSSIGLGL
jgi:hypothetical protein